MHNEIISVPFTINCVQSCQMHDEIKMVTDDNKHVSNKLGTSSPRLDPATRKQGKTLIA